MVKLENFIYHAYSSNGVKYDHAINVLERRVKQGYSVGDSPSKQLFKADYALARMYHLRGEESKAKKHLSSAISEFQKMCNAHLRSHIYINTGYTFELKSSEPKKGLKLEQAKKRLSSLAANPLDYMLLSCIAYVKTSHKEYSMPYDRLLRIAAA